MQQILRITGKSIFCLTELMNFQIQTHNREFGVLILRKILKKSFQNNPFIFQMQ